MNKTEKEIIKKIKVLQEIIKEKAWNDMKPFALAKIRTLVEILISSGFRNKKLIDEYNKYLESNINEHEKRNSLRS